MTVHPSKQPAGLLRQTQVSDDGTSTRRQAARAFVAMSLAAVILLVFNSAGLRSWTRDLQGTSASDYMVERADDWHRLMQSIGATKPFNVAEDIMTAIRDYDWQDLNAAPSATILSRREVTSD